MSYQIFEPGNRTSPVSQAQLDQSFAAAMIRVYLLMFVGLSLTAVTATIVANVPALWPIIFGNPFVFWGLIIGEFALVIAVGRALSKLSPIVGLALFLLYAALNGLTMSVIFLAYDLGTVTLAFSTAAALFGVMSVVGFTTKADLTSWGRILFMGLIGLIIASVVNIFWANSTLDWIISYFGVALFLGLTIYDTKRIKTMTYASLANGDRETVNRIGVIGALKLYLDFINLFLFILRIFGRRR